MMVEQNLSLQPYNSFGIAAKALQLVRLTQTEALPAMLRDPVWHGQPKFVWGGGSNIVITGDVKPLVIKMENKGRRLSCQFSIAIGGWRPRRAKTGTTWWPGRWNRAGLA